MKSIESKVRARWGAERVDTILRKSWTLSNNHIISRMFTSCRMGTYHTHGPSQACLHWCFSMSFCMPSMILLLVGRFMCSLVARKNLAVIGTFFLVHPIQKYATDFKVLRLSEWQSKAIMSESSAPHLLKSSLRVVASYSRLDDGGETDLDLGNYERMMYLSLGRCGGAIWQVLSMPVSRSFQENISQGPKAKLYLSNCWTAGTTTWQLAKSTSQSSRRTAAGWSVPTVVSKLQLSLQKHQEREGKYLGKTVQVVPHITGAIVEWINRGEAALMVKVAPQTLA